MGYLPYFIGPLKVGLEQDLDSYLIPEDAFPDLTDAYLWRGRVYKKGGSTLLARLGVRTDTLAVRGAPPQVYNAATNTFPIEPGSLIITDGITTFTDNGLGVMAVTSGLGIAGTINYVTGVYLVTFTGVNAGATVTANYLKVVDANSPVMGLETYIVPPGIDEGLVAFDRTSAYQFSDTTIGFNNTRFYKTSTLPAQTTTNSVAWTGSDTDFFYSTNYQNAFFATNNIPGANFYAITNMTTNVNAQFTIGANNFQVGDIVYVNNVNTAAPRIPANGLSGFVTVAGNPITTDIDTTPYGAYVNGGVLWSHTLSKTGAGDGIRWFDGFTAGLTPATGWVNFEPSLDIDTVGIPRILQGCLIIVPYKDRLVCLNTFEGTSAATRKNFPQRARYSQIGTVYYGHPVPVGITGTDAAAWYEIPGRGGFIDAPTAEEIVAAEFIKDTLVVYFESSTWLLLATGNPAQPFTWQKINTEIGAESTFSTVPFDRQVLSVGSNGIYSCDSVNIERIDRIIPDIVFSFKNANGGVKRVQGVRDFFSEMSYWTYVETLDNNPDVINIYPNRMLVYNYPTGSYSIFIDSYTTFGHYHVPTSLTWANAHFQWQNYNRAWNAPGNQSGFPQVISGNQQGFVFSLDAATGDDFSGKPISLVIQGITAGPPSVFTSVNHNLQIGYFIYIQNVGGATSINDTVFQVATVPTANTFTLIDVNNVPVAVAGYTFGGTITHVDNIDIVTKNLNPFFPEGRSMRLGYADFLIENVEDGQITINLYQNDDAYNVMETHILSLEDVINEDNDKFWARVYFESQGQFLKLEFKYSDNTIGPDTPVE
jgi:hypothetical protein